MSSSRGYATTGGDMPAPPLTSEPLDPTSQLHVTTAVNYITPELDQFVRGSAATTPGNTSRFLAAQQGGGEKGEEGRAVESTAFVPARATDLTKTAGEKPKPEGDVLTATSEATESQKGGTTADTATAKDTKEPLARCVSDEDTAKAQTAASQSEAVTSCAAQDTKETVEASAAASEESSNAAPNAAAVDAPKDTHTSESTAAAAGASADTSAAAPAAPAATNNTSTTSNTTPTTTPAKRKYTKKPVPASASRRSTRVKHQTPKKITVEKKMVRYSLALVPEVQRNPDFLHRWRVGEHDLHKRLKRRDSFVSLMQAKQQPQQQPAGGDGDGSGMGADGTPSPQKRHAVRDQFGRFIRSPPGSAKDKAAASKPAAPPPPPVTTSSGRVVKRRLDTTATAATVDGGSTTGEAAGAVGTTAAGITEASTATTASDDNNRTGSLLTTQQPSYADPLSYADHPRLISNEPAPQIGPGWTLVVVGRPGYDDPNRDSKKRGGRFDRYYFSPEGRRFKNIAEVNKYKHDMEVEHGVVVAGNVARPSRMSSRVKRLQEEAKEEEERRAKEEERMELEAEAAAMLGVEVGDIPDEAASYQDDYDKKTGAGTVADGCGTCQHFPFCSHAPPSPGKKKSGSSGGATSDPFLDDESVIWVPTTRSQWDDCVDEMTSVCYSAVLRKHQQEQMRLEMEGGAAAAAGGATGSGAKDGKGKAKPPLKPLSRDYIRDRIDIDDPIRGYQIRHKTGGWLQGFVLTTTFTTWTHYFKWDSTHPTAGLRGSTVAKAAASAGMVGVDFDGSLSSQLEAQPRSGDPNHGGVVWPTIAEISLVGALGCGEYLVRMALDDICRRDCYDYVVLQATDTSRTFYERFGFVRVGAVSKYGRQARHAAAAGKPGAAAAAAAASAKGAKGTKSTKGSKGSKPQAQQATAAVGAGAPASSAVSPPSLANAPLVGYRHWTYAEESAQSINKWHGGPSYMMALKIDRSKTNPNATGHHCVECGRAVSKVSFLDALADHFVHEKPKIMNLGGNMGRRKPSHSWSPVPPGVLPPLVSSKPGALASAQAASGKKRGQAQAPLDGPRSKKVRRPVTPVGNGRFSAEFERRQMNDPWLAVKPAAKLVNSAAGRKPPRSRSDGPQPTKASTTPKAKGRKSSKPSTPKSPPLRKQRIPPMYRDPKKTYYYNRTVKPKKKTKSSAPYYFVLNFDESTQKIQLIPLEVRGTFIGRREGRPKWKATVLPRPAPIPGVSASELEKRYFASMGVFTASAKDYIIVNSDSVHKCAGVKEDSWDIFD